MPKTTVKKIGPNLRKAIVEAHARRSLVRLQRSVEVGRTDGYISLVGPSLFLVSVISDAILFDGFQMFHFEHLENVFDPGPHHRFVRKALKLRNLRRPRDPELDLSSMSALLRSAGNSFPLVTIHREVVDPDVCHIGEIKSVSRTAVVLREITPDATWEEKIYQYPLSEITRVDFGGSYENALHAVSRAT
jgi:hypothetical protein